MQLDDKAWVDSVVQGEDIVQREDMHMCDLVQSGLTSPAYDVGRRAAPARALCTALRVHLQTFRCTCIILTSPVP